MRRLILGERPSRGGPHPAILESTTTRQLDRLCPGWRLSFRARNVWPFADRNDGKIDVLELVASYDVVVTLGYTVSRELGVSQRAPWLSWDHREDVSILKLPHPSGVNRWYNDPTNRAFASLALAQALRHCPVG